MSTTVTTQAELDAALKANEPTIHIQSPEGVWLTVSETESSRVVARGSSHVEARGSSYVVARGSSRVVARGSSHVEAWESSYVEARESSYVEARGSSHVVASAYVAVHLHSQRVELSGGVVIDLTAVDQEDPVTWCEFHGVAVDDSVATLYKALDDDLCAGQGYIRTNYALGSEVVAADWRADNQCGGGLHLGPTTHHATAYRSDASRWVAVEVPVADIRPIVGDTAKCKVRSCRVVTEVDRYGKALAEPAAG